MGRVKGKILQSVVWPLVEPQTERDNRVLAYFLFGQRHVAYKFTFSLEGCGRKETNRLGSSTHKHLLVCRQMKQFSCTSQCVVLTEGCTTGHQGGRTRGVASCDESDRSTSTEAELTIRPSLTRFLHNPSEQYGWCTLLIASKLLSIFSFCR